MRGPMDQMTPQKAKKPKVLKRKGKEVEEALLFEDQMDEAAIAEWEKKMGLAEDAASQKDPSASPSTSGKNGKPSAADRTHSGMLEEQRPSPEKESSWRQTGKLRWLGISNIGSYWQESPPRRRVSIVAVAVSFVFATAGACLFAHGLLTQKEAEPQRLTRPLFSNQMHLEMIVPIKGGTHGLLLSLAVDIEDEGIRPWMVRRKVYELLSPLEPRDVKGPDGMRRVKEILDHGLSSHWPGVRPGSVRFLEYLLL